MNICTLTGKYFHFLNVQVVSKKLIINFMAKYPGSSLTH